MYLAVNLPHALELVIKVVAALGPNVDVVGVKDRPVTQVFGRIGITHSVCLPPEKAAQPWHLSQRKVVF